MEITKRRLLWQGSLAVVGLIASAGRIDAEPQPTMTTSPFNIRAFGATGDGKTLDTAAINRAIDAAAATGGGTVVFPAGNYLAGSIHLRSDIALYLDAGATIIAADGLPAGAAGGYDAPEPGPGNKYQDFGHCHWQNSLIWGEGLENVSILGPGRIYGRGLSRGFPDPPPGVGNKAISLKNCRNVTFHDFSILKGGHFGILATGVDNLTIDNLKIDTNRDGMDIDCCHNVRVLNCSVNSPWDDGICLKSSYGLGAARATENVTISDCFVTGNYKLGTLLDGTRVPVTAEDHAGRNGRIKFGTESNGGFKNIAIANCIFDGGHGLALETVDGGDLEDVTVSNLTLRHVIGPAIFLRLGSRMRGPAGTPVGHLRRIHISGITIYDPGARYACLIAGIPGHPIEEVSLSQVHLIHPGGGTAEEAGRDVPERETAYPEPEMLGPLPAYGLYARHVRALTVSDSDFALQSGDARPAIVLDDVENARLRSIDTSDPAAGAGTVLLRRSRNIRFDHVGSVADARLDSAAEKRL